MRLLGLQPVDDAAGNLHESLLQGKGRRQIDREFEDFTELRNYRDLGRSPGRIEQKALLPSSKGTVAAALARGLLALVI